MNEQMAPEMTPLLHGDWQVVTKRSLSEFDSHDWEIMRAQKAQYLAERQADEVLRMLKIQESDRSFGYTTNNYQHCLQTATRMLFDDLPEEDVVVGLLHDVGYMVCPSAHGAFAATLLRPYISERNHWMLLHHEVFQQVHFNDVPGVDPNEREQWRGHPYFEWTETFVAKYDQTTINYDEEILPITEFEPMVRRLFAKSN